MGFIDTSKLKIAERLPGWKGRYFDSASMTFGHYIFEAGSAIHQHSPAQGVGGVVRLSLCRLGTEQMTWG